MDDQHAYTPVFMYQPHTTASPDSVDDRISQCAARRGPSTSTRSPAAKNRGGSNRTPALGRRTLVTMMSPGSRVQNVEMQRMKHRYLERSSGPLFHPVAPLH
mgnify:CR=1 FL=1